MTSVIKLQMDMEKYELISDSDWPILCSKAYLDLDGEVQYLSNWVSNAAMIIRRHSNITNRFLFYSFYRYKTLVVGEKDIIAYAGEICEHDVDVIAKIMRLCDTLLYRCDFNDKARKAIKLMEVKLIYQWRLQTEKGFPK